MNKSMKLLLLGITASIGLTLGASAEFNKTNTYENGTFTDVAESAWYSESVKDAYEYGIMQGNSASTFNPAGNLTVAEGITIAARIHETMNGTEIKEADGEWYKMYVDYAVENGIMAEDTFSDYNVKIKRSEIATLLANVCGELPKINDVKKIADINEKAPYLNDVLSLYQAGILTGNDEYGNFAPNSNLTRAEIATMAVRIADKNLRVNKTFEELNVRTYSDGYFLIDNISGNGRTNNSIANGWKYDNRFEFTNISGWPKKYVSDVNDTVFTALIRDFDAQSEGVLTLELITELYSKDGGLYIAFEDANENRLFGMKEKDGMWVLFGEEELVTDIPCPKILEIVSSEATIDLDNNTMRVYINNKEAGTIKIPADAVTESLVLGTNELGGGSVNISHVKLIKDYAVFDRFPAIDSNIGEVPIDYSTNGEFTIQKMNTHEGYDVFSVKADVKAGESKYAVRNFDPVSGNLDIKTFVFIPDSIDGASFSILAAGSEVLTIYTKYGSFWCGDTELRAFKGHIWQDLRVEANTETGEAVIKINSKTITTVPFDAAYVDGVKYTFAPDKDAVMWFDDLEIQSLIEHDDYVPVPVVPDSDYIVGMYSCNLWRDTLSIEGWDSVSPFPEFEPYLGYYDEGLRETADWEIKQLVEHGVDFINLCWYSPEYTITNPIKRSGIAHAAIHDGYLNCEYSDMMKYTLLWETAFQGAHNFEDFKKYMWDYWMEYYFTDPRYLVIDNRPVMFTWGSITSGFADNEDAEECLIMLEAEIKELGYDGLLLVAMTRLHNDDYARGYAEAGYDAFGGAALVDSNSSKTQIDLIANEDILAKKWNLGHIPTVCPGYDAIGRNDDPRPMITKEEHLKVCQFIKDMLDKRKTGTYLDYMVMVDGWNEFSEGHMVAPIEEYGWGLLDNLREVFTNEPVEHSELDIVPTPAQKERITRLYPDNYSPIRWYMNEGSDSGVNGSVFTSGSNALEYVKWDMSTKEGLDAWSEGHGLSQYSENGGKIYGESTGDSSVYTTNLAIDINEADILHIRMKTSVNYGAQIYFATAEEKDLSESKKVAFDMSSGGVRDYYLKMSTNENWKGTLTHLRIDPINTIGEFEIYLVEIMKPREVPGLVINGYDFPTVFEPVITDDGDYEIAAEATIRGFFSTMRVYHEWDRFTDDGVLTLKTRDKKTYVFRVGSDKVEIDGVLQDLGYTFKLRDGLPVFHIKKLCDLLGYKYEETEEAVSIQASTDEEYAALMAQNAAASWDYRVLTEVGDWKTRQSSISLGDGCLTFIPTGTDSSVTRAVDFSTDDYTHCLIGLRNTDGAENWILNLFFGTDLGYLGPDQCMIGYVKDYMEGVEPGEVIEVKLDMTSNSFWKGTVNTIRFDPHWEMDPVYIEYISFIKDEENAAFLNKEIVIEDEPPVEIELAEDDIVDEKYGLLLGEMNFEKTADITDEESVAGLISKWSYKNDKYLTKFDIGVFGAKSVTLSKVDGTEGTVLDIVPNGTDVYRAGISAAVDSIMRGKYTIVVDQFMPENAADFLIYRMDMTSTGADQAASSNSGKGKWVQQIWSFEVLSVSGGKMVVFDGKDNVTVPVSSFGGGNLWMMNSASEEDSHIYFDNIKVYYDSGTLGTDYGKANEEEFVLSDDDIVDNKFGVLLAKASIDEYEQVSGIDVTPNYLNDKYTNSMSIGVYGAKRLTATEGIKVDAGDGYAMLLETVDSDIHRMSIGVDLKKAFKGTYTFAMDVYVPMDSGSHHTFRFDTISEGSADMGNYLAKHKGRWVTVYWSLEAKSVSDGTIALSNDKITKNVSLDSLGGHLWLGKSDGLNIYYFDNFRLYFDPGNIGTNPDAELKVSDPVIQRISTFENSYVLFDSEPIYDEEYGMLLAENTFDYSHLMGTKIKPVSDFHGEAHGTYANGDYLEKFFAGVYSVYSTDVIVGKDVNKSDFVLDFVPDGQNVGRITFELPGLKLEKGTYTYMVDIYTASSGYDLLLFRVDTAVGMGNNEEAGIINNNKDEWTTLMWTIEVTEGSEEGKVIVKDCNGTAEVLDTSTGINIWIMMATPTTSQHYYLDNMRVYYKAAE